MFELTVALRYLIPKKRSLSTALISLLSVVVISVVVWLVLVFLSVTSGIEKNWLQKLTSLYAPLRLSPTEHYYRSYYYLSDSVSSASGYTLKTIGEKAAVTYNEAHSDQTDAAIPSYWNQPDRHPDGRLRDPVKETLAILKNLNLPHQDYEISGALLKLSLNAKNGIGTTISQMSYLLSFMDQNPQLGSLVLPPSVEDLNAMLQDPSTNLQAFFAHANIDQLRLFRMDPMLLPEKTKIAAFLVKGEIEIPPQRNSPAPVGSDRGNLIREGSAWKWIGDSGKIFDKPILNLQQPLNVRASIRSIHSTGSDCTFDVDGQLQDIPLHHEIRFGNAIIAHAAPQTKFNQAPSISPLWVFETAGHCRLPQLPSFEPVIVPKSFRDSGAKIGDRGTINFTSFSASSSQEQRIFIQVVGFYDPGLFSMGGRCLIVPTSITQTIHTVNQTYSPDGTPTNGIGIWSGIDHVDKVQQKIEKRLQKAHLSDYWKVDTFKNYEFSKDLFQQFRSDRTLFLLIALIILLVACCNIISLLVLLVNDKKREIAILQSLGASRQSIAIIFGSCGLVMGTLSSIIGTFAAIFTLHHLDRMVQFLSSLQGHAAFQPAFFGNSLPNQLSHEALLFIFIATPLLSLLAGLIPAIRASRIRVAQALRQE